MLRFFDFLEDLSLDLAFLFLSFLDSLFFLSSSESLLEEELLLDLLFLEDFLLINEIQRLNGKIIEVNQWIVGVNQKKKLHQLFIEVYLSSSLLEESDEESLFLSFLEDFSDLPDPVRLLLLTADLIIHKL